MLKRLILAGAASVFIITTAQAGSCPAQMAKIDAALPAKMADLSASKLAKVKSLRAKGEAKHKAGDHGASVAALNKAIKIMGLY